MQTLRYKANPRRSEHLFTGMKIHKERVHLAKRMSQRMKSRGSPSFTPEDKNRDDLEREVQVGSEQGGGGDPVKK